MTNENANFDTLLDSLFDSVPVKEKEPVFSKSESNNSAFTVLLDDLFTGNEESYTAVSDTITTNPEIHETDALPLQACNLYSFMRRIVIDKFGMGLDYAFIGWEGEPLKAWWTLNDVLDMAKTQGYSLTAEQATRYLDNLIRRRYIETKDGKYRRCAFWDKSMENYLVKAS